jgi:ActR/RegA family two-component response regulator
MTASRKVTVATARQKSPAPSRVLSIGRPGTFAEHLAHVLTEHGHPLDYAAGSADALHRLRSTPYEIVVTDPETSIEEDLALLEEIRLVRPGVRAIVLAPGGTPEEIIAALRARVYLCKCAPFDPEEIADYLIRGMSGVSAMMGIEVLSAHRDWISVRIDCHVLTADRLISYLDELQAELPAKPREELMTAFREVLLSSVEHGAQSHPAKVLDIAAVRTERAIVLYLHDPGMVLPAKAVAQTVPVVTSEGQPHSPVADTYNHLVARGVLDELLVSETGQELLLIKHTV